MLLLRHAWLLTLVFVCFTTAPAWAQTPDDASSGSAPEGAELDALEQQLDEALTTLSTADCVIACQALESMMRAADRICVLDGGARCDAARAKVAEANRRVREACPECTAVETERDAKRADVKRKTVSKGGELDEGEPAPPAPGGAAPEPVEGRGGGCAACSIGRAGADGWRVWLLLVALGALAWRRSRRG